MIIFSPLAPRIAARLAVLMTAMVIVVGISVAPLTPEVFAATNLNSSKSN
jgi:hypothetical protein